MEKIIIFRRRWGFFIDCNMDHVCCASDAWSWDYWVYLIIIVLDRPDGFIIALLLVMVDDSATGVDGMRPNELCRSVVLLLNSVFIWSVFPEGLDLVLLLTYVMTIGWLILGLGLLVFVLWLCTYVKMILSILNNGCLFMHLFNFFYVVMGLIDWGSLSSLIILSYFLFKRMISNAFLSKSDYIFSII